MNLLFHCLLLEGVLNRQCSMTLLAFLTYHPKSKISGGSQKDGRYRHTPGMFPLL